MKATEFINQLKISRKPVFSFSDLVKILGKDETYAKVFINRLSKKELLKLERNKYAIKGTNQFLIASNILFPSYISFLSAYSYYNLTTQLPRVLHVVTMKQRKPLSYQGALIHFIRFKKSRFFGFRREILENKFLFIAEVEKAIIDSLYLPKYCSISETFFAMKNAKLDVEKLLTFAKKFESLATKARLGYLLELVGLPVTREELKPLPKNYTLLNPFLSRKGKKNKKWKLIINEVLE